MPLWALHQSTITVSGYPAVPAAVLFKGGVALGVMQLSSDARAYAERQERAFVGLGVGSKARCHGCRKWAPRAELQDVRLGFDAYCDACIQEGVTACLKRDGRLPGNHEFYCLGCELICDREVQALPDADGRRRSRCVLCRTDQVRAADRRRRDRRWGLE